MSRFSWYGEGLPAISLDELTGWLIVLEGTDGAGRSTHIQLLKQELERAGFAVAETGLSRSDLASRGLSRAKQGNTLGANAFNLFYATDLADRLERQIIPALRAGFVMLTDRYIFSLIARAIVRGADPGWIRDVYSFALKPDAVFYLRIEVPDLVPRVLSSSGFDYWESGMDIPMGVDHFESFTRYQGKMIEQFDRLANDFQFDTIDATRTIEDIHEYLWGKVGDLVRSDLADPDRRDGIGLVKP